MKSLHLHPEASSGISGDMTSGKEGCKGELIRAEKPTKDIQH